MSDPIMSEISLFGCNFAPRNWAFCMGQLMAVSEYQSLYSLLGTTYGGDGRTSFGLPDLRGRTAVGPGIGPGLSNRVLGQKGGWESVQLSISNMPSHNHAASGHASSTGTLNGTPNSNASVKCNNSSVTTNAPAGKVWGANRNYEIYADDTGTDDEMHAGLVQVTVDLSPVTVDVTTTVDSVTVNNAGGNMAHDNMSPFLVLNYSICTIGLYPSRN